MLVFLDPPLSFYILICTTWSHSVFIIGQWGSNPYQWLHGHQDLSLLVLSCYLYPTMSQLSLLPLPPMYLPYHMLPINYPPHCKGVGGLLPQVGPSDDRKKTLEAHQRHMGVPPPPPTPGEDMGKVVLEGVKVYITRMQILEIWVRADRRVGLQVPKWWW